MNFKVYRGSWVRGSKRHIYGDTTLLNYEKNMCCLGQVAHELGIPLDDLEEQTDPRDVPDGKMIEAGFVVRAVMPLYAFQNSAFSGFCITHNDNSTITDKQREALLIEEFKKNGHTLKFVAGKAPWFNDVR